MKRKLLAMPVAAGMTILSAVPAFASSGGDSAVSATDWSAILSSMTAQINVSTIVGVCATTITAGIGIVFMWWGARKLVRTIMSAFRKGKLSL